MNNQTTTKTNRQTKQITDIKWGDILFINFGDAYGSEQGGIRPALVVQNNVGNTYSPTTIVCAVTSQHKKALPTHLEITPSESGLSENSFILFEQIRTIDKSRVIKKVGNISQILKENIQKCLMFSLSSELSVKH